MSALYYWDGAEWKPISTGGGGVPGPAGADGISIEVFGPQPAPPESPRKGDHWLNSAARSPDEAVLSQVPPAEPVTVQLLPDPPGLVFIKYLD